MLRGCKLFFGLIAFCGTLGFASARAGTPESSANALSPTHGLVHLNFFASEKRIEVQQTRAGHSYRWLVRNGVTGAMLQGADGAHCMRYRQFVRATPRRVSFGWSDRKGEIVGLRWIARACLGSSKTCDLHEVKG